MKPVIHTDSEPEIVSRITELLLKQGKTQKELLEYLGLHRNNYTEWKAGRNKSFLMYIDNIARYFDVSPTYLLRGEAEENDGDQLSEEERELIQMYRWLDDESKEKLMITAEILVNLEKNHTKNTKK